MTPTNTSLRERIERLSRFDYDAQDRGMLKREEGAWILRSSVLHELHAIEQDSEPLRVHGFVWRHKENDDDEEEFQPSYTPGNHLDTGELFALVAPEDMPAYFTQWEGQESKHEIVYPKNAKQVTSATADAAKHARIAELERDNERRQSALDDLSVRYRQLEAELQQQKAKTFARFNNEECWIYQGDGTDELESLVCPVVISAAVLADQGVKLAEAEASLWKYGEHQQHCKHDSVEGGICTCGFHLIIAEIQVRHELAVIAQKGPEQ